MHQPIHLAYLLVERRLKQALINRQSYTNSTLPKFIIEPKADLNYPVVSAASIVAKVHRDRGLEQTPAQGSGYPSDPKTRNWLKELIRSKQPFPLAYDSVGVPLTT